jgi:hypothetical protein
MSQRVVLTAEAIRDRERRDQAYGRLERPSRAPSGIDEMMPTRRSPIAAFWTVSQSERGCWRVDVLRRRHTKIRSVSSLNSRRLATLFPASRPSDHQVVCLDYPLLLPVGSERRRCGEDPGAQALQVATAGLDFALFTLQFPLFNLDWKRWHGAKLTQSVQTEKCKTRNMSVTSPRV